MENIPCDPDIKKWVDCSFDQLFDSLKTNSIGLSSNDADERLKQYGYNILPETRNIVSTKD